MERISRIAVGLVSLLHVYILVLEMFLWQTERGQKAFAMTAEQAASTATLAANQGLYNGFLAAGLIWGLLYRDRRVGRHIQLFFLGCVAVAGVYGAYSAKLSILFVQALPAAIAGALVLSARSSGESSAA
jgi:putative membrane protein